MTSRPAWGRCAELFTKNPKPAADWHSIAIHAVWMWRPADRTQCWRRPIAIAEWLGHLLTKSSGEHRAAIQ